MSTASDPYTIAFEITMSMSNNRNRNIPIAAPTGTASIPITETTSESSGRAQGLRDPRSQQARQREKRPEAEPLDLLPLVTAGLGGT